jgi:hypothetical protein
MNVVTQDGAVSLIVGGLFFVALLNHGQVAARRTLSERRSPLLRRTA